MSTSSIAVIGAGAWGTAMARLLAKKGNHVSLWSYEQEVANNINRHHRNEKYLPNAVLPDQLTCSTQLNEVLRDTTTIVIAQPSRHIPRLVSSLLPYVDKKWVVTFITKGLVETDSVQMLSDYWHQTTNLPLERTFCLSGPNFAVEIAQDLPACSTLAGINPDLLSELQSLFSTSLFRIYTNPDMTGVQLGGPLKNVIAIAAGILSGMNLGQNIHAALLVRGSQEMKRLLQAMGATDHTMYGLACLGDLILTCSSPKSRNFWAGLQLSKGITADYLRTQSGKTIEGIDNLHALLHMAQLHSVELPICSKLQEVLFENKDAKEAILELMKRDLKQE